MTSFRKTHQVCGTALALGLLVVAAAGAQAAPIQFGITDLGQLTGTGLDNDGHVIDQPMRNIVGEFDPRASGFLGADGWHVVDGMGNGRLLISAGFGASSHPLAHTYESYVFYPGDNNPVTPHVILLGRDNGGNLYERVGGNDMNSSGDVVGSVGPTYWRDPVPKWAFFVSAGSTTLQDLNDLIPPNSGWKLNEAYSINDRGQILGVGVNPEGQSSGFLLTPAEQVPEPGAWAVFGLAAAAFAWRKRRAA